MNPIGIMQGRLSPRNGAPAQSFPWHGWQEELVCARACGFDCLEWLVTADRFDDNPIWDTDADQVIAASGVAVRSLCADCFIARPFVRVTGEQRRASMAALQRLVRRCGDRGIAVLLVPVIENGALTGTGDADVLIESLRPGLDAAESSGVRIALESDWPGPELGALIDAAGSPQLGAYYDVGNAAAIGHDSAADVRSLGPRLFGVHIKDRPRGGVSVPLGDGDADFDAFFSALSDIAYEGPLILETPAGADPIAMARRNLAFVKAQ